ncbi:hypothetical protein FB645_003569 [Coemansia sp. IMI 203386]|nr:hypothetical protein FB645_003569 [Coemansia sp. IMI 203386]
MLTSTFTRKSGSDAELPSPVNHVVETEELQNLSNLSVGITQAMQQAFPGLLVSERTVLPESLRNTANIIIKTFMLPDSPLAINAPSDIVAMCKAYLTGGQLTFGMLDRAKDEVIDMLYCNGCLAERRCVA